MQRRVISLMYGLSFHSAGPMKPTRLVLEELQQLDPRLTSADLDSTLGELMHPWSRLNPLIDVSGASCRLTPLAEELLVGIETDTIDFELGSLPKVPRVLPARVPVLLAKGTDGIPPHHLGELIAAAATSSSTAAGPKCAR